MFSKLWLITVDFLSTEYKHRSLWSAFSLYSVYLSHLATRICPFFFGIVNARLDRFEGKLACKVNFKPICLWLSWLVKRGDSLKFSFFFVWPHGEFLLVFFMWLGQRACLGRSKMFRSLVITVQWFPDCEVGDNCSVVSRLWYWEITVQWFPCYEIGDECSMVSMLWNWRWLFSGFPLC